MTTEELVVRITSLLEEAFSGIDERGPKQLDQLYADFAALDAIKSTLNFLQGEIGGLLVKQMPEREIAVDGIGTFVRSSGSKRTSWDHDRLASVIAARTADDFDGEPPAVFAEHVAKEIQACAGFNYWRVGELRKRGIKADTYCEKSEGTPRVQLNRAS